MLACPRCGCQLRIVRHRRARAHRCPRCDGHAITYPVIRDALDRDRWQRLWRRIFREEARAGVRCPGCGKAMAQVEAEALVLDSCRTCHLLWFDRAELERLPALPEPPRLPPAAAEAAARMKVAADAPGPRSAPESTWQIVCGWLGLPFEIDSPQARRAYVTAGLAVLLLAVHAIASASGLASAIETWGFLPDRAGRHGGATWITSFFLHGGWLHLFSNAYFLVAFGDNVEEELGAPRYSLLLLLGTVLGCGLHGALDPRGDIPLVGASAGISAVLVYYAFRFPDARIGWALRYGVVPIFWFRMGARAAFAVWLLFQLALALAQRKGLTNVSAFGHLGGVLAGIVFVAVRRVAAAAGDYDRRA